MKIETIKNIRIFLNVLLVISVVTGFGLFLLSFSPEMTPKQSSSLASLGGIVPSTALLIERFFFFVFKKKE
ncbi:hypothetical protein [Niveispirillum irakense]|uniref:hypothetical protein n=1 Tax=Niveispirillum irakense TaxID=34011 RepID=UPI0012B54E0E|nr:hypothetical protein [Niveispirillum irakense]